MGLGVLSLQLNIEAGSFDFVPTDKFSRHDLTAGICAIIPASSIIISINNDPLAPINTIADYVISGDLNEVLPKMVKYYKQNTK